MIHNTAIPIETWNEIINEIDVNKDGVVAFNKFYAYIIYNLLCCFMK